MTKWRVLHKEGIPRCNAIVNDDGLATHPSATFHFTPTHDG